MGEQQREAGEDVSQLVLEGGVSEGPDAEEFHHDLGVLSQQQQNCSCFFSFVVLLVVMVVDLVVKIIVRDEGVLRVPLIRHLEPGVCLTLGGSLEAARQVGFKRHSGPGKKKTGLKKKTEL